MPNRIEAQIWHRHAKSHFLFNTSRNGKRETIARREIFIDSDPDVSDQGTKRMRARAILGSVMFLILAPGTVIGLIPWWISKWKIQPMPPGFLLVQLLGVLLLVTGILILLEAFGRFALQGIGTPAPVLPTRHLVVTGLYRYVRNPMYVARVLKPW